MATGEPMFLAEEERSRIEAAVRETERRTSAEIVPMVVARSGLYREASYRAGVVLAAVVLALLLTTESLWLPWGWHAGNAVLLLLLTMAAYGVGVWFGTTAKGIRWFVSRERMRHKVRLRAERAFAQHGVGQTRERTGVLLLVSLLERQVSLWPDRALRERVPAQEWEPVVAAIVPLLSAGNLADGLCVGIDHCGRILADRLPPRPGDNPDELPNRVIQE